MDTTMTGAPGELGWASVEACTLPTVERPLRLAAFDDLFAGTLRSVERTEDTRARLLLSGDAALADRVLRLADAESACCSFFTFTVGTVDGQVALDVEVAPAYAHVLTGLVQRAEAVRGEAP